MTARSSSRDRSVERWLCGEAALAISAVALAVLFTACSGGGSGPGVAQASSTSNTRSSPPGKLAFATCMRSHRISNFPDSDVMQPGDGIDPNSPQFQAAQRACQSVEPQGQATGQESAAHRQARLHFSACVRRHGVPDFPDPSSSRPTGSVITIFGIVLPSGMDPQSPVFQAAMQACQSLLPGGAPKAPPKTNWGGAP